MPHDIKPRPIDAVPRLERKPDHPPRTQPVSRQTREIMHREIIVSGDDALAKTIAEELRGAGARIIQITTAADLLGAGVHRARAVVCAGPDDAVNLEIALLAREYSPNVRVVARLSNDVLREAVDAVNGPGAILDVADLAAPSVVEAVLSRNATSVRHGRNRIRCLGSRGAVRRDSARDLRRPGAGGGGPRQERHLPPARWCHVRDGIFRSTPATGPR